MGGGLKAKTIKINNLVAIDSSKGLMAFGGTDEGRVEVSDSTFIGGANMQNLDCPDPTDTNCSNCIDKLGLIIPVFGAHKYETVEAPDKLSKMYKFDGNWGGSSLFTNLKFSGWEASTNACGG